MAASFKNHRLPFTAVVAVFSFLSACSGAPGNPAAPTTAGTMAAASAAPLRATSIRVAAQSQSVDPGVIAAVNREMSAFDRNDLPAFLADFTADAVVVDDAEPLFIAGSSAIAEWFHDNRAGAGMVTLTHQPATDYALIGNTAFIAFPFTITIQSSSGTFVANGTWTGTFRRQSGDMWKIRSLTIAILSSGQ